jgi:putative ABC transport system permease protein
MRGQVVTIALVVACGIASYVSIYGTYVSLLDVRDTYYARKRFPDVLASVERAPDALQARLNRVPGVTSTYVRQNHAARAPIPGAREPAVVQVLSLPQHGEPALGALEMRNGRMPEPGQHDEAVVLESFAQAHELMPGDHLPVVLGGVERSLRIVGLAQSPEFVFAASPGDMMPDPKRFGVVWMRREVLAAAFRMEGAWNELLVRLSPEASEVATIGGLDRLLAPYGGLGAYGNDRQLSNNILRGELAGLQALTSMMPTIFLAVAAFLVHVVLSRLVQLQRTQVAVLKAIGYSRMEVGLHYLKLVAVVVVLGAVIGTVAGYMIGDMLVDLYGKYFHFPKLDFTLTPRVLVLSLAASLGAAVFGASGAVRAVMRLPPAEAMRPEPPATYRRAISEKLPVAYLFGQGAHMVVREIERRPLRALMSTLGVAMAVALLVAGRFGHDAVDWFMRVQFELSQREDMMVGFRRPVPDDALRELRALPGVLRAEGLRIANVRIRAGHRHRQTAIMGYADDAELRRVVDRDGRVLSLPDQGVMLNSTLADILHVEPGDEVTVELLEGDWRVGQLQVASTSTEVYGLFGHMRRDQLTAFAGDDGRLSTALLVVDPEERPTLLRALRDRPDVLSVARLDGLMERFEQQTAGQMRTSTLILTIFAAIIAVGVVYNNARISLATRSRDLASLRVLGFRRREISAILLGELSVHVALALIPGMWLGTLMAESMMAQADPEMYRFPAVISAKTYAFAMLVTLGASLVSALIVRRDLDRLDLIGVLKSRE